MWTHATGHVTVVEVRGRVVAVALAALLGSTVPGVLADERSGIRVRKDVADLTVSERRAFVDALHALKRTASPYDARLSWYDQLVAWHVELARCDPSDPLARQIMRGHAGPMFLPWHRRYLVLLEDAMTAVTGRKIAVPYWDWTNPRSTHAVFRDDFMGGNGDPLQDHAVVTGPFRKGAWNLTVRNIGVVFGPSSTTYLTRNFGSMPTAPSLPTAADHAAAFATPAAYDVAPWDDASDATRSFRNAVEGYRNPVGMTGCPPDGVIGTFPFGEANVHNRAHVWVGGLLRPSPAGAFRTGTLAANIASPNDPVFFLLHSNVDRLWAEWQDAHGVDTYAPASGVAYNSGDDVLRPLDAAGATAATPRAVADIRQLGYRYAAPSSAVQAPVDPRTFVCDL